MVGRSVRVHHGGRARVHPGEGDPAAESPDRAVRALQDAATEILTDGRTETTTGERIISRPSRRSRSDRQTVRPSDGFGYTLTLYRFLSLCSNFTCPSTTANSVSSDARRTFVPGWNL